MTRGWFTGGQREFQATASQTRESLERHRGLVLRPGQLRCAWLLTRRCVVEFATGEGKTAGILPAAAFHARRGRTVWIATANDYLARRDADFAGPVFADLGLTTGCITQSLSRSARQSAYRANIIYGTLREFIFDHLRDRLRQERSATTAAEVSLQPGRDVLICDEADSLLIDEALTPCIISAPGAGLQAATPNGLRWGALAAGDFQEGVDYLDHPGFGPVLTPAGEERLVCSVLPEDVQSLTVTELAHCLELALLAGRRFREGEHYVVDRGQVRLVDESTGRIGPGKAWSRGLQQAVEAREEVPLTQPLEPAASLTIQQFARGFGHLCGLTGTAREAAAELRTGYQLRVQRVPEHVRTQRKMLPERAFRTLGEKLEAIVQDVGERLRAGRAVLVGTRTVKSSEFLSAALQAAGIEHAVLNARNPQLESQIIARAGQPGQVSVATNMAGRGTDITLHPDVRAAGGLHVIGTELHSSSRIDRQLAGRCGRQGDPGTFQQFLSLEDDLLSVAAAEASHRERNSASPSSIIRRLRRAQRQLERRQQQARRDLDRRREEEFALLRKLGVDPVVNPFPEE